MVKGHAYSVTGASTVRAKISLLELVQCMPEGHLDRYVLVSCLQDKVLDTLFISVSHMQNCILSSEMYKTVGKSLSYNYYLVIGLLRCVILFLVCKYFYPEKH